VVAGFEIGGGEGAAAREKMGGGLAEETAAAVDAVEQLKELMEAVGAGWGHGWKLRVEG
jgi:hypothetical protein